MPDRAEVMAFADRHGNRAAAEKYGVPSGTVRSWRSRARKRAARDGTAPPTPAERWLAEAQRVAERYIQRQCLQCGDDGTVNVPAVTRGSLLIRKARRIPCPSCGGPVRRIEVTEWPKREWTQAMAAAGDAGLGWSADEWARIRAGDVNPDGMRFTGRPDA
jgi:transposase-like protein